MDQRLIAALPELLEIAKKREYPESVIAAETISDVLWQIALENGDLEPEHSAAAKQACTELGDWTYEAILGLSTETITRQFNGRLANAKDDIHDLWFALCMVAACKLVEDVQLVEHKEVIYVEWSFWDQYDPEDMVEIPHARFPLMSSIPYPILNLLLVHYGPGAFDLDKLFAEVEHHLKLTFARYRELFVMQKLTSIPS